MADERTRTLQSETTAKILPLVSDPRQDLARERARGTFPVEAMTELIYGRPETVQKRREYAKLLASKPEFSKEKRYFMSREELYEWGLHMQTSVHKLSQELGLSDPRDSALLRGMLGLPTGFDLHFGMFLPTLLGQGAEDQQNEYLPKALNLDLIGTYAQTELGHGTFLRGLETTATYDAATQEFILHSPTITSTKWWPGGLAKTSNHCVLMARLFIKGKDFGPHAFLVQIRDQRTHLPLPGVEVGDIGPKLGFNAVDNGYLRFDHVRIPRTAMLMKNAQVTAEGDYVSPPVAKASYGTMVLVRSFIVVSAAGALAKAMTIALRYSAVRRQTSTRPDALETQIMDYQGQQYQLFPLLATAYALQFTGNYMQRIFLAFQKTGDTSILPEVHATSSGLKALVTQLTADGIEVARKCCGGHGYSHLSGLPLLYEDYVAACTYEGENTVMALQTARYLLKALANQQGKEGPKVDYLLNIQRLQNEACPAKTQEDFLNPDVQLAMYAHRAAYVVATAAAAIKAARARGLSAEDAFNACTVDLVRASRAHCFYLLVKNFVDVVRSTKNPALQRVLKQLCDLFCIYHVEQSMGDFFEDGYLSRGQALMVRQLSRALLIPLRPEAVALVDAWDLSDYELNSALGRYDGNVYEAMLEWTRKHNPMNAKPTGPGYERYLKPFFTSNL